jgi:hypothetical protein
LSFFTAREKAKCAWREVRFRKRVYPGMAADGRMAKDTAALQIAMMEEIARDYDALADAEEKKERLI